MTGSSTFSDRLSSFQHRVLAEFFARERHYFLTGGAALAGYHLGHRETSDLDLFTLDDEAFERGRYLLQEIALLLDGELRIIQDAPGFLRAVLVASDEGLVVDLVRERVRQLHEEKPVIDGVIVDPPDEILVNKLTALVSRAEERDLIDVYCLVKAGLRVEDALAPALDKDGGCTPANLAWVLSQVTIPDDLDLPAGIESAELQEFVARLIKKLLRLALPAT